MRSKDSNIPAAAGYTKDSAAAGMNTAWGIAVTGVQLFNGLSADGTDPFYPSPWGSVTDTTAEKVDGCMAHPQAAGIFHYHIASPCIPDKATYQT